MPEVILLPLFSLVFLFIRLVSLMSLPIFTDEAIYTRWAQIARQDANWRFISLTDGKQPSFVWLDMVIMKFFRDPLMAGRVVSVIAGLIMLFGIYFLTREVFKTSKSQNAARIVALIACAIFVLYPFSLVYDRMAIYDSLVAAFFVWALYFQILLVRRVRLDIAMVLGFILGGSVLTKSIGFLSIYMTPFLLFLFNFEKKGLRFRFVKFILYAILGVIIANVMYSILRLSPFFHIISEKNSIFIYSVRDWLDFSTSQKVQNFMSNFSGLFNWFYIYFTIPYILLAISAFFVNLKQTREKIVLLLWFLLPFGALCVFGKTLYPRYELFMTMPLIPLVAYSLFEISSRLRQKFLVVILFAFVFFLPLRSDFYILTDFYKAPIPHSDIDQYISGWPAGGGVRESVSFFEEQAKKGPIYIATEGTFGLMPYAYEIYLIKNKNITIKGFWPIENKIPQELLEKSKSMSVYVVFYQPCSLCNSMDKPPLSWSLIPISEFVKPGGQYSLSVYRVKNP